MNAALWVVSPPRPKPTRSPRPCPSLRPSPGPRQPEDPDAGRGPRLLHGGLEGLHDPYLMKGMDKAVDRVRQAIDRGEKILVFGDYDVDGVLSTVMLVKALRILGPRSSTSSRSA